MPRLSLVGCAAWLRLWCFLAFASLPVAATTTDFSSGWRFHAGDPTGAAEAAFDDTGWPVVDAPHPVRLEALVTDHGEHQQWEGICWYRKSFHLPPEAAGQVVQVRFEGAMNRAQAFVNGQLRGESIDGYTPFVIDLSDLTRNEKPITLALRLDNTHSPVTGPKPLPILDFHLYHGLYRSVWLSIRPPLHITDEIAADRPASGGVFVTYPEVSAARATVAVKVHVRNAADSPARFRVATRLWRDGAVVAESVSPETSLASAADVDVVNELLVERPQLWSPRAPHLHDLEVELRADGAVIDRWRERIGLRRFELGPNEITINGEKQFLRGVNRHQEYPYVGNAVPAPAQYRDAFKIKQAGFDFIRVAHYPQSREFMQACDELGLVVLNAILGWQYNPGTPEFQANRLAAARALVRRDRNHPSSMLWELSLNESRMSPEFVAQLHAVGHEEYPTDQMATAGWMNGYDVKVTARQHGSTKEFQQVKQPSLISEYGDWEYYAGNAGLNQDQWGNLKESERNSRQRRGDGEVRLLQQATNLQEAHNENRGTQAFADGYWVMFDYNRGYATDHEASGVMDIFRLPKFSHAFYQSQRDPDDTLGGRIGGPMVHLATWWTEQSPTEVRVFSNCEEVELWLNGRSLGRQRPDANRLTTNLPHPPFTFALGRFEPGELRAVGYLQGQPAAEHRVRTPGAAARLELVVDRSGRDIGRDGDLVFIHARVVDAQGTVVPQAPLAVLFEIEGPGRLIGDNPISGEAGVASILLQTRAGAGPLRLRASAPGLSSAVADVFD